MVCRNASTQCASSSTGSRSCMQDLVEDLLHESGRSPLAYRAMKAIKKLQREMRDIEDRLGVQHTYPESARDTADRELSIFLSSVMANKSGGLMDIDLGEEGSNCGRTQEQG